MAMSRKMRGRRFTDLPCAGRFGAVAVGFIQGEERKNFLLIALALGGVAWASILSMPYAILAGALPATRHGRLHGHLQLLHRAA